jgi:hypothetical protein
MEDNKNNLLINDAFVLGVNININEKVYSNKDIFIDNDGNKKLVNSDNYDDVLSNIDLIKNASDSFLQSIIDQNPLLKNIKEKKENLDIEE